MTPTYKGNTELLSLHKVAFFAASRTATLSVLPTLDWVAETAMRSEVAVCCGFQSLMERKILPYLLRGRCGIIVALTRPQYVQIPDEFGDAFAASRILFVSFTDKAVRPNKSLSQKRNQWLAEMADSIVLCSVTPDSSLYSIQSSTTKPIITL